jgi:hypothetical protein
MDEHIPVTLLAHDEQDPSEGARWAGAFLAGFKSIETRRAYRRDLECWFVFCTAHQLHPFRGVRRTHLELYLRELERQEAPPAPGTLYRRVSTLGSWFRWLEDEDVTIGNPAARIRRPQRHSRPQPWLNRNELTDLLAAAEDDSGGRPRVGVPARPQRAAHIGNLQRRHHRPRRVALPADPAHPRQGR